MIVHHFPRPCPPAGWPNLVIHARGRGIEYAEHEAPLSIKCVLRGQEVHEVRGIPYLVDEDTYLVLNNGQRYSSWIAREREAETFTLFFEQEFAASTLRCLVESEDRLLDEPMVNGSPAVEFFETLYPRTPGLSALLHGMRSDIGVKRDEPMWLEEQLSEILAYLLQEHLDLVSKSQLLGAVRSTTRTEQYRRLLTARDFIEAYLDRDIDLASIAAASCLSSFHLLRLYKEAFGETPHQYLTRRRLELARHLLTTSDLPIWKIGQRVGYENLSSFSRLASRQWGTSPRELRRRLAAP